MPPASIAARTGEGTSASRPGPRKRFVRFVALAHNPNSGEVEYADVQLTLLLTGSD
jgi:hypothetical protein